MPRRDARHRPGALSIHTVFTDVSDGDLCIDLDEAELDRRRQRVAPHPWTWLRQVHGAEVVEVSEPGDGADSLADAAVTEVANAVLAVHTADCAGVLIGGGDSDGTTVIGAAHAGWRGLQSGVLQSTVAAMRARGAREFWWDLGPCISPAAYEFGAEPLEELADRYGSSVVGRTLEGAPAFDLRAAVSAAMAEAGLDASPASGPPPCTALDPGFFSWRTRGDKGRQVAAIWLAHADESYPWHP